MSVDVVEGAQKQVGAYDASFGQQIATNAKSSLALADEVLVQVWHRTGARTSTVWHRRGQKRAMRGGLNFLKPGQEAVIQVLGNRLFREDKRRHLLYEKSDILSAEVAMQSPRSP
ncbi:UNVERIFIED_CONTAM: hypothetical protein Sradi_6666400 [Sesamum radiatum]|uniref:Uncharacterized protein n=1 Tax=Sesamum radiatum TaxID=300843 RepID=A0AAW2JPG3_SESRA